MLTMHLSPVTPVFQAFTNVLHEDEAVNRS